MSEDPPDLPQVKQPKRTIFKGPPTKQDYEEAEKLLDVKKGRLSALLSRINRSRARKHNAAQQLAQLKFQERAATNAYEAKKIDKLTGLLRAEDFKDAVDQKLRLLGRGEEEGMPNAALVVNCDVKGLKSVNDGEGGHSAGDELLKSVAELIVDAPNLVNVGDIIRNVARLNRGDIAGRLGGDEFGLAIFFNTHSIAPAEMQALFNERLMTRVQAYVAEGKITGLKWNSALNSEGMKVEDLLDEADPVEEHHPGKVLEWPPAEILPSR